MLGVMTCLWYLIFSLSSCDSFPQFARGSPRTEDLLFSKLIMLFRSNEFSFSRSSTELCGDSSFLLFSEAYDRLTSP